MRVQEKQRSFRSERGGFTLVELMLAVAIIGILSTILIPTFTEYVLRARSTEGVLNISRMNQAASVYVMTEHYDKLGKLLPRGFPWATVYPALCSDIGAGMKCNGDLNNTTPFKSDPTFEALDFSISDPHYFTYSFAEDFGMGGMGLAGRQRRQNRVMPAVAMAGGGDGIRMVACAEAYLMGPESERGHFTMLYGLIWDPKSNRMERDGSVVTDAAKSNMTCTDLSGGGGGMEEGGEGYGGEGEGYGGYGMME